VWYWLLICLNTDVCGQSTDVVVTIAACIRPTCDENVKVTDIYRVITTNWHCTATILSIASRLYVNLMKTDYVK